MGGHDRDLRVAFKEKRPTLNLQSGVGCLHVNLVDVNGTKAPGILLPGFFVLMLATVHSFKLTHYQKVTHGMDCC